MTRAAKSRRPSLFMTENEKPENETPENELDIFLGWLSPNPEQAAQRYLNIRCRLVYYFVRKRYDAPEDMASEVLQRAVEMVAKGVDFSDRVENYIFGIARNVGNERNREIIPLQLNETLDMPQTEEGLVHAVSALVSFPNQETQEKEERFEREIQATETCLEKLSSRDRYLFVNYLLPPEKANVASYHEELAKKLNMKMNNLRVKYFRLRKTLQKCVEKNLNEKQ